MKPEVMVVDYGLGNLLSISRAFEHLGISVKISSNHTEISKAKRVVLPGVGAFPRGMKNLVDLGLDEALLSAAEKTTPILGICLGMQLLFDNGMEHKNTSGLGLLPGTVEHLYLTIGNDCVVPSVGWMRLHGTKEESFVSDFENKHFYFVHSYVATPKKKSNLVAEYKNCSKLVSAAVQNDNVCGVQFHPEKSGKNGLCLLKSWIGTYYY